MPRVAVLQLFHEASCIAPLPVTREEFVARHHICGPEVAARFGHTENWLGGVLSALSDHGIVPEIGLCTACLPGGPVAADDFAVLLDELLASLDSILRGGPVSHVILLLHGALLAEGREDPEGDIAHAVRLRVGPDARIAVPLDFHANPGPGLIGAADIVIAGRLYPHTDTRARGARLVDLALSDGPLKIQHVPLRLQVPMPRQETVAGPFGALATMAGGLEGGGIADISLLGGFPFSRAPFRGTSLLITAAPGAGSDAAVHQIRTALNAKRDDLMRPCPAPRDALPEIRAALDRGRVVMADVGDNPGGGGLGDDTSLLALLVSLERPFAFGFLVAPTLVADATRAGTGGSVTIATPQGPLAARVERLCDISYRNTGPMMRGERLDGGAGAVLSLGPSRVIVASRRVQAYDANAFSAFGVDPEMADLITIKSSAHFRASFGPLATGGVVLVDSGGLSSPARAPAF